MSHLLRHSSRDCRAFVRPALLWIGAVSLLVVILSVAIVRSRSHLTSAGPAGAARMTAAAAAVVPPPTPGARYHKEIKPVLEKFCFDCHADGANKGNMSLDEFKDDDDMLAHKGQWLAIMKNVRAGVMPPPGKPRPTEAQQKQLAAWIKQGAFGIDPKNPDPGRVTIHRLNRLEYRNTMSQLLGVDYNTEDEFPPDAAGLGLDNIADLLSISPLILEKYLKAAEIALDGAMPSDKGRELVVPGSQIRGNNNSTGDRLPFSGSTEVVFAYRNKFPGSFHLKIEIEVAGENTATNTSHFVASEKCGPGSKEILLERDFSDKPDKYEFDFDRNWSIEPHVFTIRAGVPGARSGGRGSTGSPWT